MIYWIYRNKFEVNVPSEAIIYADKKRITQVIYNLINNAINYTGDNKLVIVNVIRNKKYYLVEIIDTGKGIKKKNYHIYGINIIRMIKIIKEMLFQQD